VPLDGSEVAQRVLPSLIHVAGAFGAEVILARIVDHSLREGSSEYDQVLRYLNRFADRLAEAGVGEAQLHVASGEPAQAILEAAREHRVDLVAMATHGRTGFDRLRLGSVAEEVVRRCPCPLLVVGAGPDRGGERGS
jgi:nucleotide-binding universal stress UspA family protein